jgi:hypothetical protein
MGSEMMEAVHFANRIVQNFRRKLGEKNSAERGKPAGQEKFDFHANKCGVRC